MAPIGGGPQQPPQQQTQARQKRGSSASQYGPGIYGTVGAGAGSGGSAYGSLGNVSASSAAGPAPTTKPPTPPQAARYSSSGNSACLLGRVYVLIMHAAQKKNKLLSSFQFQAPAPSAAAARSTALLPWWPRLRCPPTMPRTTQGRLHSSTGHCHTNRRSSR